MVNPFLKNLFLVAFTIIFLIVANSIGEGTNAQYSMVVAVIDGDTIEIEGGQRVRYGNGKLDKKRQKSYFDKRLVLRLEWSRRRELNP